MPYHCQLCPPSGRCSTCETKHTTGRARERDARAASRARVPRENTADRAQRRATAVISRATAGCAADPWLLLDNDVFDEQAVNIASRGMRKVKLTLRERVAAATAIFLHRGTVSQVCKRLSLPRILEE